LSGARAGWGGSLTLWIEDAALECWQTLGPSGAEPLTAEQCRDLLEIVEDRYNRGSLIITSQVPVDCWYEIVEIPRWPTPSSIVGRTIPTASR
jgi:hypothetical protein